MVLVGCPVVDPSDDEVDGSATESGTGSTTEDTTTEDTTTEDTTTGDMTTEDTTTTGDTTTDTTTTDTTDDTTTGMDSVCGDGMVEGAEECDDGNTSDDDACVGMCMNAVCGDGLVHVDVEECDDANLVDDDECSNGCVAAVCGDTIVQTNEECDVGDADPGDGCSASCQWEARIVFTTSTLHTGNLGGLVGADAICTTRAQAANLPGTYMAWIGTIDGAPSNRFVQSTVPYVLTTGIKIADDWADLTDGSLDAPIDRNEVGGPLANLSFSCQGSSRPVWTGVDWSGMLFHPPSCVGFTSDQGNGLLGLTSSTGLQWTVCGSPACSNLAPIYCFQQ